MTEDEEYRLMNCYGAVALSIAKEVEEKGGVEKCGLVLPEDAGKAKDTGELVRLIVQTGCVQRITKV